jgi:hypothetical protein|tara:strand:- start:351 stop:464 length:114 start_codon:yes stop_codon:yes gene_type:complete
MGPYGSDVGFAVALLGIAGIVLIVTLALEYLSEKRDI